MVDRRSLLHFNISLLEWPRIQLVVVLHVDNVEQWVTSCYGKTLDAGLKFCLV